MKVVCNEREFVFITKETVFDSIRGFRIHSNYESIHPYCTKIKNVKNEAFLLTMERPDFMGPVINIIDLNRTEPSLIFSIQREPIEIFTDSVSNKTFIVLKKISGDPGYYNGYEVTDIPLFELYELKSSSIGMSRVASHNYNLEKFEDYDIIMNLKNPVYGYKEGKREIIEGK